MKKLRVAVVNTQPPLFLGGVERRILETAKRLRNDVDLAVYSGTKARLRSVTRVNGVPVVPCFSTDWAFPLDNLTFNLTLARNAAAVKADVYEAHTASGYGLLNSLRKRGGKVPFVQTVHGVLADEYFQARLRGGLSARQRLANFFMWQLARHERESAQKASLVVTISNYSKRRILQLYGVDEGKIRLVPNGVDTDRFKPAGDCTEPKQRLRIGNRPSVLFVGRLIPRKGLQYLLDAAKTVVKEQRDVLFVIVGNGPLRGSLTTQVQASGLAANFRFMGDTSEKDLTDAYRCTDLFALPSIQEGQGIALLEAQASAKPVVAFNVSGVAEAARNGETGFLVKPADSAALAEAVLKLLADASLRQKMGAAGREFVQQELSWDVCARKLLAVYREAAELA